MKSKFIYFLIAFVSLNASVVFGQTTFTAQTNNRWNNAATWNQSGILDADGIPDANDVVIIPSPYIVNMTGAPTTHQAASLTIQSGGTLNMNAANAVLNIVPNGGFLQVDAGGVISNAVLDDNNDINFLNNGSLIINGSIQADRLDFEGLNQTVTITGSGTLLVREFRVDNSGITINLNTTGSFGSDRFDFLVDMPNLTINGTGTIDIGNSSDLDLAASGLSIGCHLNVTDDIDVTVNGSSLTITNGGVVTTVDDVRIGPGGVLTNNAAITVQNGGTLTVGDDFNFNIDGGMGSGANNFTMLNYGTVSVVQLMQFNSQTNNAFTNFNSFTQGGNVSGADFAGGISFTNAANATYNVGAALDLDVVFDFTANGNTVNYYNSAGITQNIATTTYYNLTLSSTGAVGSKRALGSFAVRGNWTRSGFATFNANSQTVTFSALAGAAAQSITAVGGETFYNLTINSAVATSPQIVLNNPVTVSSVLTMTAGNVNLNGNTFTISSNANGALVHSQTSASGWMYGGSVIRNRPSSAINIDLTSAHSLFPLGTATDWRPFFVGQTASGGAAGMMTVSHNSTNNTTSSVVFPEGITRRHNNFWTLSAAVSGGTYSLQAGGTTWGTIEAGAAGLLDLRMSTSSGVVGTHGAATGGPDYRINRTAVPFASLANNYHMASTDAVNSYLPIEAISFTGEVIQDAVQLNWETASELNNDFFTVERSSEGEIFSSIGQVTGKGTTNQRSTYSLIDHNPIYGTAYYRLKQTDFDGTFTYSKVIVVTYEGSAMPVLNVFPNPSRGDEFNIKITGIKNTESIPVVIYDQLGRECLKLWLDVDKNSGTASQSFTFEKVLPQGMYLLKAGHLPKLTVRFSVAER